MDEMDSKPLEKMIIEAQICLTCGTELPTAVSRGMSIYCSDGEYLGKVAAVLLDGRSQQPTNLILARLATEYRLVPLCHIVDVSQDCVMLNITNEQLTHLPLHKPKL